tara:strand:+ start:2935 stop:3141 length:207 start_codon:yes stop_codon:yes gene_type:complete
MKIWISLLVIYAGFFLWYTDVGGKLDEKEIEFFLGKFEENASKNSNSLEPESTSQLSALWKKTPVDSF